jgi:hypothetical protein
MLPLRILQGAREMSNCPLCGEEIKKIVRVVDSDGVVYGPEYCLWHARKIFGEQPLNLPNHSKIPFR